MKLIYRLVGVAIIALAPTNVLAADDEKLSGPELLIPEYSPAIRELEEMYIETADTIQPEPVLETDSRNYLHFSKSGAMDRDCDGAADSQYTAVKITPGDGQCVIWRLVVENPGAEVLCNVTIKDHVQENIGEIAIYPFIVREPQPGQGMAGCSSDGQNITCLVGTNIDTNRDGKTEKACLRPGNRAEVKYSMRIL